MSSSGGNVSGGGASASSSSGGSRKKKAEGSSSSGASSSKCCGSGGCCGSICKCLRTLLLLVLGCLLVLIVLPPWLFEPWLDNHYVFDPAVMQQIAQKAIQKASSAPPAQGAGGSKNTTVDRLVEITISLLAERYPDYIHPHEEWVLNNAGGAMGSMLILHSSLTEYVIIFGTAVGTEGHTGRYLADDYFTILHGQQWAYPAGSFAPRGVWAWGAACLTPREREAVSYAGHLLGLGIC